MLGNSEAREEGGGGEEDATRINPLRHACMATEDVLLYILSVSAYSVVTNKHMVWNKHSTEDVLLYISQSQLTLLLLISILYGINIGS